MQVVKEDDQQAAAKKKYSIPQKCPECDGKVMQVRAEGFNSKTQKHDVFHIGGKCRKCGILIIQPEGDCRKIMIPANAVVERIPVKN